MDFVKFSTLQQSFICAEDSGKQEEAFDVLLHLVLCHSIVVDPRTGDYNSSSPDELALV